MIGSKPLTVYVATYSPLSRSMPVRRVQRPEDDVHLAFTPTGTLAVVGVASEPAPSPPPPEASSTPPPTAITRKTTIAMTAPAGTLRRGGFVFFAFGATAAASGAGAGTGLTGSDTGPVLPVASGR